MSDPSESLFDTKFTASTEQQAENSNSTASGEESNTNTNTNNDVQDSTTQQQDIGSILPVDLDLSTALINYRILVTRREAGVIIGKNGDSVTQIREETGVKAGVSRLVEGCVDRILTIGGVVDNVAKAIGMFAQNLVDNNKNLPQPVQPYSFFPLRPLCPPSQDENVISLRLMIPNSQMGALIGKQGVRIKAIQDSYAVKLVASKDNLFNSTERIVEIQGVPQAIDEAIKIVSKCLLEDFQTPTEVVYYNPSPRNGGGNNNNNGNGRSFMPRHHSHHHQQQQQYHQFGNGNGMPPAPGQGPIGQAGANGKIVTENVPFPADIVGALIGKRGSRIQEVRRSSGCTILVEAEDNENGERVFTLTGSNFNVEKALAMFYNYLEREKAKRASASASASVGTAAAAADSGVAANEGGEPSSD